MSYQALYRVWRSQRFADIVGQQAITQTLKNAIKQDQISHAYLFTGPRGTGKTSAAKIFAKAVNCPHQKDGEPCNECEICRSITQGTLDDVIEMDAASNNGVDEVRLIRDRANYAPTQAKYKVYIIDEVHMLSTGAFNALLKTLEEPKKNVIFILATTEVHKIPATIISRTQRFDFKRIGIPEISEHLAYILDQEQVAYDQEALQLIARCAEGGMRDALSILDQAIAYHPEHIDLQTAMSVTGSLSDEVMAQLLTYCEKQDIAQALTAVKELLQAGKEAKRLLENLLVYCRDLLIAQKAPDYLAQQATNYTESFHQLAKDLAPETIFQWIEILSKAQNELRFVTNPTIYLEVAIVKLSEPIASPRLSVGSQAMSASPAMDSQEVQQLKQQIQALQKEVSQLKQNKGSTPTENKPKRSTTSQSTVQYRIPKVQVFEVLSKATREDLQAVNQVWEELMQHLQVTQRALLHASKVQAASPDGLVISFGYEILCNKAANDQTLLNDMQNYLSLLIKDYSPKLVFIPSDSWSQLRREFITLHKDEFVKKTTSPDKTGDEQANSKTPQQPTHEFMAEELANSPEQETEKMVQTAQELFGDLVKIEE
ncbi:DNA polymerase III subunit gamma/tau [Enterococcus cecorum]|nr:DNA polymerase III subunit gamma/tau [Enterococcus cecorum]